MPYGNFSLCTMDRAVNFIQTCIESGKSDKIFELTPEQISSEVVSYPCFWTTYALGSSPMPSTRNPVTVQSSTAGWDMIIFSKSCNMSIHCHYRLIWGSEILGGLLWLGCLVGGSWPGETGSAATS